MPTNFQQFSLDVRDFADRLLPEEFELWVTLMSMQLWASLINGSPVGNPSLWMSPAPKGYVGGSFRGAWVVTLSAPSRRVVKTPDADGAKTLARGQKAIDRYKGFGTIWFTNNLPYARRIEDGWSTQQAPQGVVEINLLRIESTFRVTP